MIENSHFPEVDRQTQCKLVFNSMKQGIQVSSYWGFKNGIIRLASRIYDLKQQGHTIYDKWHESTNGKKFKLYYID